MKPIEQSDDLHADAMAIAYDDREEWTEGCFKKGYKANLLASRIEELVTKYSEVSRLRAALVAPSPNETYGEHAARVGEGPCLRCVGKAVVGPLVAPSPQEMCACHSGSVCGEACLRGICHDGCSKLKVAPLSLPETPTQERGVVVPPTMHFRVPHTFKAACGRDPLPNGIKWTTDLAYVTCPDCAAVALPVVQDESPKAAPMEPRELKSVWSLDGRLLARFYDYTYYSEVISAVAAVSPSVPSASPKGQYR